MKYLRLSDELFDRLKDFVVNPFEDTPDIVIHRLIEISHQAKKRWSPFEDDTEDDAPLRTPADVPIRNEHQAVVL